MEIETGRWSAMPAVDTVTTDQVLVVLVDNHGAGTCGAAPFFCSELVSMAANLDVLPRPIRNEATAEALHEYRSLTTANQAPAQRQRQYTLLGLLAAMLMSKAQRHSLSQPADGLRVIALIDDVRTRGDKFEGTVYGVQAAIPGPWLGTSTPAGRA
ncbi:MAG TPA: hypothetical protein VLA00_15890 [Xanthobacteraceae bacterium]|nr:hypothetical protein [Xanthobacteraceae bacterium]